MKMKTIGMMMTLLLLFTGCKGKVEEKTATEKTSEAAREETKQYPRSAPEVKQWVEAAEAKADKKTLETLKPFTGKFSAGEILRGVAVRPRPDYWEKVSDEDKKKTLAIMNTAFSKVRIEAGQAENVEVLNSTLYLEDGAGTIVAVSEPRQGSQLL